MSKIIVPIQIRGMLEADLPASASVRELIATTDTHKLYVGTGTGLSLVTAGLSQVQVQALIDAAAVNNVTANPKLTVQDLGYPGLVSYKLPMAKGVAGSTLELQDSPFEVWDLTLFGVPLLPRVMTELQVILATGAPDKTLGTGLDVEVQVTANTAQQGNTNTVGIISGVTVVDAGAGGQVVDEVHGFETGFGDVAGVTTNEFLAYRVHFAGSGGSRGSHIAFCSNTSTTNFALNKGLFVSPNYEYALDLNPTVASCLGTAPICHSTQNGRRLAPTVLDGWYTGTGDPNGVVTANVGSFYSRRDGGTGSTFYVKESGSGNTGWVAK